MKFKEKISHFFIAILILLISYLLCSSHQLLTTSDYISRRKRFCATPFYVYVVLCFILVFIFNY